MKKIQMVDLSHEVRRHGQEYLEALKNVLESGAYIKGPEVKAFEQELAAFLGIEEVVGCANGTDALQLAYMALGLEAGDEIIIPAFTYIAPAEMAMLMGLKPVYVDVAPDSFLVDIDKIESLISEKTKCIVAVHLFGQCVNMESLVKLARKHNVFVIEDNAQSIGSKYKIEGRWEPAGTHSDITTTSFFPTKNLGGIGDGGAIWSSNSRLIQNIRRLANHGQELKYQHESLGMNSRLDSLQAAVLRIKLKTLAQKNEGRQRAAAYYNAKLGAYALLSIPQQMPWSTHTYHQYCILLNSRINRDALRKSMSDAGVSTMVYYPKAVFDHKPYRVDEEPLCEVSKKISQNILALPIYPEIRPEIQDRVISALIEGIALQSK